MESYESTNDSSHWNDATESVLAEHFPLHRACRDGDVETLQNILVNSSGLRGIFSEDTFYGWNPVHYAAYFGRLACLRKLLTLPVFVSCEIVTTRFGQTPCHLAAFGGSIECLKWLLDSHASVFTQDYLGETPAHKAARSGSIECLNLLYAHGSSLSSQNNAGQTPLDVAELCNQKECANYIRQMQVLQNKIALTTNQDGGDTFEAGGVLSYDLSNGQKFPEPIVAMGCYGYQSLTNCVTDGPIVVDVTMDNNVSVNVTPVAGRKRSRNVEVDDFCTGKRLKVSGDYSMSTVTCQEQFNNNIPMTKTFGCYF